MPPNNHALSFLLGVLAPFFLITEACWSQVPVPDPVETVNQLRQQLAKESVAYQTVWIEQAETLNQKLEERQALADRRLRLELKLREMQDKNHALERDWNTEKTHAERMRRSLAATLGDIQSLGAALLVHLAELPGRAGQEEKLRSAVSTLTENADPAATARAAGEIWGAVSEALADAAEVRLQKMPLRTASGKKEAVFLLTIGHVSAAYVTEKDGRVGLTIASPEDAAGFRWTEAVPTSITSRMLATVQQLIQTAESGATSSGEWESLVYVRAAQDDERAVTIAYPLDISGRMRSYAPTEKASLMTRLKEGGRVIIPLILVAVIAAGLVIERLFRLYVLNPSCPDLAERVLAEVRQGGGDAAQAIVLSRRGFTARILAACLRERHHGAQAMEDAIQGQFLRELPVLRRFLPGLAILAAVAPLLGLLGTVTGIIRTFEVLKTFNQANPHQLAGGISEALVTTAAGLVIAIPILLLQGLFRGRIDRLVGQAEGQAAELLIGLVAGDTSDV
ncbi:MAG: MotA/TolQ/ExbB proton channel family protein [Lentisphaeria bacterium]|nr:MotA/TolQ/ExbB proton channel family protein [Lentisphaeria bacterium]